MPQTEFYDHNVTAYMSLEHEAAVNTMETGEDDFMRIVVDANAPVLPELLSIDPTNQLGSGNEFETGNVILSDYFDAVRFDVGDLLGSDLGGALFQDALGGGLTNTPVSGQAGAHDHDFGFALDTDTRGFNVLTRTYIWVVGGVKYLFGGCGVDEYTLTWDGGEFPRFKAGIVGTGYHKPLSDYPSLALPTLESQDPFRYMQGVGAALEWTGTPWGGLYNAAASGRFMAFTMTVKNNIRIGGHERQPNDPVLVDADGNEGAVQNRLRRGEKREVTARVTLRADNQEREKKAQVSKALLTNLKVAFYGSKIGATAVKYGWTGKLPKFRIIKVTHDSMDGEQVIHIDLKLYKDVVTGGLVTGSVRNNFATSLLTVPA
jgi:hypothetical protein